jgi:hypothetical protein
MSDKGLGQVAATVIVRYEFTDEGEDGSQLPHRCRSSRRGAGDLLPVPFPAIVRRHGMCCSSRMKYHAMCQFVLIRASTSCKERKKLTERTKMK